MRVVWAPRALHHVDGIAAFLESRSLGASGGVLKAIRKSAGLLAAHPSMGRLGRVARTRELVVPRTAYIIVYTTSGETAEIVAVMHEAQSWPKRF